MALQEVIFDKHFDKKILLYLQQEQLDRLKECCQKAKGERGIQKKKEGGFLSRFTKRRKDSPTPLRIEVYTISLLSLLPFNKCNDHFLTLPFFLLILNITVLGYFF